MRQTSSIIPDEIIPPFIHSFTIDSMAYSTEAKVREMLGLDDNTPATGVITNFITQADNKIDQLCAGSPYRTTQSLLYTGDGRYLELEYDVQEIKNIYVDGKELTEYDKQDLMEDGDCDISSNSTPDYWNEEESSGDTLAWSSDYSYNLFRSLKITKGGASESYWYSDDLMNLKEETEYQLTARIKVDSNASTNTYLRMEFRDSDDASIVTYDSATVTIQITQPSSASVVTLVSDDATDTTQSAVIEGTVNGIHDYERVEMNGTTDAVSTKSFSYISGIRIDTACAGSVTSKTNSGAVTNATFTAGQKLKEDWQLVTATGPSPHNLESARALLRVTSATGNAWGDRFRLYERNWKLHPSSKQIEFMNNLPKKTRIRISYLRTKMPALIETISLEITSLYVLANITGGKTSGINFEDLKSGKYGSISLFDRFKEIRLSLYQNIRLLQKGDHSLPKAFMGTLE